jgi:cation diffusion facilitator CzcD-associated flavoprotein CzcO
MKYSWYSQANLVCGLGPQGLAALKNLREEGFNATILEKRPTIGGIWQYTEERGETSVLQSKGIHCSYCRLCKAKRIATLGNVCKYRVSGRSKSLP